MDRHRQLAKDKRRLMREWQTVRKLTRQGWRIEVIAERIGGTNDDVLELRRGPPYEGAFDATT